MRKHLFPFLLLLAAVVFIALQNTPHDVFLTGWDNLHPEFDLSLNIFRSIFSVWEEYQGVGLLAGMGYAATLPYQLLLLLFSFLLPINLLRFLWTYFMLFLGPLGMYYLQITIFTPRVLAFSKRRNSQFSKNKIQGVTREEGIPTARTEGSTDGRDNERQDPINIAALLGAFFYLFNLATLQAFYAPLEVFTTHFGFLPWLFLTTLLYGYQPTKKHLFFFIVVLVVSMAQAYVPTVFFVYLLSILIFMSILWFFNRTKNTLFSLGKMLLVIFLVNSFWLLPFGYFTITSRTIPVDAKINQMSTDSIFWQNKEFGHIWNVATLQGFWFNNLDPNNSNPRMMAPWTVHLNHWYIWPLGFIFFAIILVGFFSAFTSRYPPLIAIAVLFVLCICALTTATPPFSWMNDLLRTIFPLMNQVFRFPFTKFSILASFTYAIFFAIGVKKIIGKLLLLLGEGGDEVFLPQHVNSIQPHPYPLLLGEVTKRKFFIHFFVYVFIGLLISIYMFPIFQGHVFYEKEKISISKDYFTLFSYLKQQNPNARIADLPQNTFWSWPFYTWGYAGSGFLWYGISQPILDRAFDPWSGYNENYYWQLSNAFYSQNAQEFLSVLNKYQISTLLVDKNQYNPANSLLFINPNLDEFLASIPDIKKETSFGNIELYTVNLQNKTNNFIFLTPPLQTVNKSTWTNSDTFFTSFGNYKASAAPDILYPFADLFSQHQLPFTIAQTNSSIIFTAHTPDTANALVTIPALSTKESLLPFLLTLTPPATTAYTMATPSAQIHVENGNDTQFVAEIKKITDPFASAVITPKKASFTVQNCDNLRNGTMNLTEKQTSLRITSTNADACLSVLLPYLSHTNGYVLFVTASHVKGRSLHLWVSNPKENFLPLDTYLPETNHEQTYAFILPPMEQFTASYLLQLENIAIGGDTSVNEIGEIAVYPIPYDFLKNITISTSTPVKSTDSTTPLAVNHPNPSLYTVTIDPDRIDTYPTLVLSQAYDPGWKAYVIHDSGFMIYEWVQETFPFFFGKELTDHFVVNNWENGWTVDNQKLKTKNETQIVIVYVPQFLEYAGFLLVVILLVFLSFSFFLKTKNESAHAVEVEKF